MTQYKKFLFILLPMLVAGLNLQAQTTYKLAPGSELSVSGTSTIHDWTMTTGKAQGNAVIVTEANALKGIQKLQVSMQAETLKSGKSGMDDNAYKALKTKKHPEITFNLKEVKSITQKGDQFIAVAEGTVTIGGVSKTMNLQALADPATNSIKFTGNKSFKLTDFQIDPPTAVFGTIKTGDEVTVNYNLTFKL